MILTAAERLAGVAMAGTAGYARESHHGTARASAGDESVRPARGGD
jgi:hypothetical protein